MTTLRTDPELRVYNFAKLVTLLILAGIFALMLAFWSRQNRLTLNEQNVMVMLGDALRLSGTGVSGESLQVLANGELLGETQIDASNQWIISAEAPNEVGVYEIQLVQGQNGPSIIYPNALVVDEAAPAESAADEAVMADGEVDTMVEERIFAVSPNLIANQYAFADGHELLSGTAPADTNVLLILDDQIVAEAAPDAEGKWEKLLLIPETGAYDLRVAIADQNGTIMASTDPLQIVHYLAPTLDYDAGDISESGEIALFGQSEPMADIAIEFNGEQIAETEATARGGWRWSGVLPANSEYAIRAIMIDDQAVPIVASQLLTLTLPAMAEMVTPQVAAVLTDTMVEDVVAVVETETLTDTVAEAAPAEAETVITQVSVPPSTLKLPDALASDGRFNTLYAALDLTGNVYSLKLDEKFTLFAPTDTAFGRLPERVLTGWQNNPDALRKVLLHHLIRGEFLTENLTVGSSLVMADGQELLIGDSGAGLMLAGVPLQTQIEAKNGVIHELDRVILPTSDFAPTLIDSSGVATFKGTELVIVGSAEVGATILVELNGESYGEAVVDAAGFWRVAGIVEEGEYEILAYALNEKAVLQNISPAVLLLVQE